MSYTKRSLNVITVLLTILIFMCLYLIYSQISFLKLVKNYDPNIIYSKAFPIYQSQNKDQLLESSESSTVDSQDYINNKQITINKVSNLQQAMQKAEDISNNSINSDDTQRDIINNNKDNRWRIEIPKVGLNAHIEEGTFMNILVEAVGHIENTATWNGNVCLAAHNRGYRCNFFKDIKNLEIGDEIIYHTEQGKKIYKVITNKTILETDLSYIKNTQDNRITLITCEENRREYRRCVQAVEVLQNLI